MHNLLQHATLDCGLEIVHRHTTSPVAYLGYVVKAGTRDEATEDYGMAHFIEHMSFKGTGRRRACHISNGLERVGGDLNAFTNKQETVYCATVLCADIARAADLLTDIVFHSTYPQREIEKETAVICDEIDSYRDSPAESIFDEFESMLFDGHPLGRDILGKPERLRSYTTADARRFADTFYRPDNATFYISGDIAFDKAVKMLEKLWRGTARPSTPLPTRQAPTLRREAQLRRVNKETHQAHVVIGTQTYGGYDDRRYPLLLLNNMLGGPGMNSRLNVCLREKAGLVYAADSSLTTYADAGWWCAYFGCDTHDTDRCLRLTKRILRRFIDEKLSPKTLQAAKKQLCGQIGIALDRGEDYAIAMGKTWAQYGTLYDPEGLCRKVNEVTAEALQQTAAEVFDPDRLTTLIYE